MDERIVNISINFSNNFSNTHTSIQLEIQENNLTVDEYINYIKKAGLVYGFTEAQLSKIKVED